MSQAIIHCMNIGTLATWLSVAGFGAVGVLVPHWSPLPAAAEAVEMTIPDHDFTLADAGPSAGVGESQEVVPPADDMEFPVPPELPPMAAFGSLPEIPEPPAPPVRAKENPPAGRAVARRESGPSVTGSLPDKSRRGSGGAASTANTSASRLAAGIMPAPSYPAEARRRGQAGTVVVEFTVDAGGQVISAHASSPSPWPLLNNEAVRTVRRWKFPPGGIMKLQRPIVFQIR
jgi:protein TonB